MPAESLLAEEKAAIYGLFANVFAKEPIKEFLQLFQQEENEKLLKSYGVAPLSDIKHLSLEEQVETLAVEYTGLFLAPKVTTSPRESLQRGEQRLWGDSTVEVNVIYKKFGFKLDPGFKDTPDHLSVELAFLARLINLEAEYSKKSFTEAVVGVREVKKFFLKNHLLKWFPDFKDGVIKTANLCYYKELSKFLGAFLDDEWKLLKNIKDIEGAENV